MAQPVQLRSPAPPPVSEPDTNPAAYLTTPGGPPAPAPQPRPHGYYSRVPKGFRDFFHLPEFLVGPPEPVAPPVPQAPPAQQVAFAPQAAPAVPAVPQPLKLGDTGDRVLELQRLLKEAGYFYEEPNRTFGASTKRALLDFQAAYVGPDGQQLGVYGVGDQATIAALRSLKRMQSTPPPVGTPEPDKVAPSYYQVGQVQTLALNSHGPDVWRAQVLLRALGYDIAMSSTFDQHMQAVVADFQRRYILMTGTRIETDGKIGQATGLAMASSVESMRESPMTWYEFARQIEEQQAQPPPVPTQPAPGPLPPPMPRPVAGPVLKAGSPDKAQVTALQQQLISLGYWLTPDGAFGNGTAAALADFQRLYTLFTGKPLTADGVCNDATREALRLSIEGNLMSRLPAPLQHGTISVGYTRGVPTTIVTRALGDGGGNSLETRAALAYYAMHETARRSGVTFKANEGFRTWDDQNDIWQEHHKRQPGQAASPGWSTHQNGIAIDAHGETGADNAWIVHHAKEFGFIYPGYTYTSGRQRIVETWHREYRVDRMTNAARAFYGLPHLAEDPTPTSPPPSHRRRRTAGRR